MGLRSTATAHTLKASSGMGGRTMTVGGWMIVDATVANTFANIRVPKYIASALFPKVTAYTLR